MEHRDPRHIDLPARRRPTLEGAALSSCERPPRSNTITFANEVGNFKTDIRESDPNRFHVPLDGISTFQVAKRVMEQDANFENSVGGRHVALVQHHIKI